MACAILFGSTVHHELGELSGDSAQYILLAQSLSKGQGYRDLADPDRRPHIRYRPLLPWLLAPVVFLCGPRAFWPMHVAISCWALVAILLTVGLLRMLGDGWGAWLAAWATAVHPWVVMALLGIMTEFPYLAFSLAALCGLRRYRDAQTVNNRWLWIAAGSAAAAVLTRAIGWTLVMAGVCSLGDHRSYDHRRRWRQGLAWLALVLLPVGAWMARNALIAHGAQQTQASFIWHYWRIRWQWCHVHSAVIDVTPVLEHLQHRGLLLIDRVSQLLGDGMWSEPLRWLPMALVVVGWTVAWARPLDSGPGLARGAPHARGVVEWYCAFYGLMLIGFPVYLDRFLLPVLPLLWHYLWVGGRWCVVRIRSPLQSRVVRTALVSALVILLIRQGIATARMVGLQHHDYSYPVRVGRPLQWARMDGIQVWRHEPAVLQGVNDYWQQLE